MIILLIALGTESRAQAVPSIFSQYGELFDSRLAAFSSINEEAVNFSDLDDGICFEGGRYTRVYIEASDGSDKILQPFSSPGRYRIELSNDTIDDYFLRENGGENGLMLAFSEYLLIAEDALTIIRCDYPTVKGFITGKSAAEYKFYLGEAVPLTSDIANMLSPDMNHLGMTRALTTDIFTSDLMYKRIFERTDVMNRITRLGPVWLNLNSRAASIFPYAQRSHEILSASLRDQITALQSEVVSLNAIVRALQSSTTPPPSTTSPTPPTLPIPEDTGRPYINSRGSCGGGSFGQRFWLINANR